MRCDTPKKQNPASWHHVFLWFIEIHQCYSPALNTRGWSKLHQKRTAGHDDGRWSANAWGAAVRGLGKPCWRLWIPPTKMSYHVYMGMGQYLYIDTIFSGMNIHKSQLFWCEQKGYQGFDTHPHIANKNMAIWSGWSSCNLTSWQNDGMMEWCCRIQGIILKWPHDNSYLQLSESLYFSDTIGGLSTQIQFESNMTWGFGQCI